MSTYNYNNYGTPSPGPGPGNTGPNRNNSGNEDFIETVSWIIDIGLIFAWFPVGLFLTIANAMGHNFVGSIIRSIRKSMGGSGSSTSSGVHVKTGYDVEQNQAAKAKAAQQAQQQNAAGWTPSAKAAEQKKESDGIRHVDRGARAMEIAGWIVGVFGVLATIGSMGSGFWSVLSMLAVAVGGGALIWSARKARKKEAEFKRCLTVSGTTGIVKLSGLAKTLGVDQVELEKQLADMIDRGYYGERAYIDHARGLLVIEPEQMRDVYKAEDEAKAATSEARKTATEMASDYDQILEQIHQADVAIEDEVMSEKIRTMRELTAAIFQEVEEHPAKKPQIQRFMNYYLPTTLKLLDSYARIEQQGVSGSNMAKSKAEIERIADTLVEGYKKQLDTLYRSEAVDIAGDVSLIESMMRRDGLTGQNDFNIKTAQTETKEETSAQEGQVLGGH